MSESGFLFDTNVISEGRRKRPDARVATFLLSIRQDRSFVSVLTIGELRKGVSIRARYDKGGAAKLGAWIDGVETDFASRILPVDLEVVRIWGDLTAARPRAAVDTLIAATALAHDLTLVTRNTRDVADTGVTLVNPWSE